MASGSFYVDTSNEFVRGEVSWNSILDEANNRSSVTVTLKFSRTNTGYTTTRTPDCYIRIGESSTSYTQYSCDTNGESITITYNSHTFCGDATRNVNHNSDGTGTAYIRISGALIGSSNYTLTTTAQTVTLDTNNRITTINTFSCPDLAGSTSINISATTTSYNTSYSMDFSLECGGATIVDYGSVSGWTNIDCSVSSHTLALSAALQDAILELIPTSTSTTLKLYCRTQNGTTTIGETSKTATANVSASVVPTITSVTATELITSPVDIATVIGKFVKTQSNIRLAINGAAGAKSSTISSYTINYLSVNYSGATKDTGIVSFSGSQNVRGTVVDSRGRSTYTDLLVEVLDYVVPSITSFTVQRCNSGGTLDEAGDYIKVVRAGTASSLMNSTEKNTIAAKVYYKDKAGVSPSSWTEITNMTVSASSSVSTAVNNTPIISSSNICSAAKAYDFKFEITDKFNTTISYLVLSTGSVVMSWGTSGVGIGKVQQYGVLDVAGDIYTSGNVVATGNVSATSMFINTNAVWHTGNLGASIMAYKNATTTLGAETGTNIDINTIEYNTNTNIFSVSSGSVSVLKSGVYSITAMASVSSGTSGYRQGLQIIAAGNTYNLVFQMMYEGKLTRVNGGITLQLAANDTITLAEYNDYTSSKICNANLTGNYICITKVG